MTESFMASTSRPCEVVDSVITDQIKDELVKEGTVDSILPKGLSCSIDSDSGFLR